LTEKFGNEIRRPEGSRGWRERPEGKREDKRRFYPRELKALCPLDVLLAAAPRRVRTYSLALAMARRPSAVGLLTPPSWGFRRLNSSPSTVMSPSSCLRPRPCPHQRSHPILLRIKITAEVDGVRRDYEMTFGRYGKINAVMGYSTVGAGEDAERLAALIKALTGVKPRMRRVGSKIKITCSEKHLEGFALYAELYEAIRRWLEETSRR